MHRALRSWRLRTGAKGVRERMPLRWWSRFLRLAAVERMELLRGEGPRLSYGRQLARYALECDLRHRRDTLRWGRLGAAKARARRYNAVLRRLRWRAVEKARAARDYAVFVYPREQPEDLRLTTNPHAKETPDA